MTDDATVLIPMNVLSRQLAAGCPLCPDLTGWTYDADRDVSHGHNVSRAHNTAWQARTVGYLSSGTVVILVRPATGLDAASTAGALLFQDGAYRLYATR